MSNFFSKAAKAATTSSPIIDKYSKVTTDAVIQNYPDGLTVDEFDIIKGQRGDFPVFHIAGTDKYFNGGSILASIAANWVESYEGDVATASRELKDAGGVRMVLSKGVTKEGRTITRVTILED